MKKNFLTVLLLSSTVAFSQEKKQRDRERQKGERRQQHRNAQKLAHV